LEWCKADENVDDTVVNVLLRGGGAVALHKERVVRLGALEGAGAELRQHESADVESQTGPQRFVIRFEDGPLNAVIDTDAQKDRHASHRDVAPFSVAANRARAPNDDAAAGHGANDVDHHRIELVLFGVADSRGHSERARHTGFGSSWS